jgi:hypothetical protein
MKPSIKVLTIAMLILITFSLFPIFLIRRSVNIHWKHDEATRAAHTLYVETDSIRLEAPPPDVKWYDVTFGIDTRLSKKQYAQSPHIFSDLGLILEEYGTRSIRNRLNSGSPIPFPKGIYLPFVIYNGYPLKDIISSNDVETAYFLFSLDSTIFPNMKPSEYNNFYIGFSKYSKIEPDSAFVPETDEKYPLPSASGDTLFIKHHYQRSEAGIYHTELSWTKRYPHFLTQYDWRKGLWKTEIEMYFPMLSNPAQNLDLMNKVRDRIFEYYRSMSGK